VKPWRCIILAIDPGSTSGWSIWADGNHVQHGVVDVFAHAEVAKIVASAVQLAELGSVPLVLVLERAWSQRALGASRVLWAKAWEAAGCSARRIVRAYPSHWRSKLFGHGMGRATQGRARAAEQSMARVLTGKREEIPHDAAAAVCIGRWATLAPEVGKVIPARYRASEVA